MERKDEQQPDKEQKPMAQPMDEGKRKPDADDEEADRSVGKVSDPQGDAPERKRDET